MFNFSKNIDKNMLIYSPKELVKYISFIESDNEEDYDETDDQYEKSYRFNQKDVENYLQVLPKAIGFKFEKGDLRIYTFRKKNKWGINITYDKTEKGPLVLSYSGDAGKFIVNAGFYKQIVPFNNVFDALDISWEVYKNPTILFKKD